MLFPRENGDFLLWWQFGGATPSERFGALVVSLTRAEAEAVAATSPLKGTLEDVRRRLRDNRAIVVTEEDGQRFLRPYVIPREVSESHFVAELDAAAESTRTFEKSRFASERVTPAARESGAHRRHPHRRDDLPANRVRAAQEVDEMAEASRHVVAC